MSVIGLDLSLTSTGISTGHHTSAIRPKKLSGIDRIRRITDEVIGYLDSAGFGNPTIAIEGPSFGSTTGMQHERGGLWWHVVDRLDAGGLGVVVVAPATLKKYATGKGNAGKDEVLLAASRRFDWFAGGNDEADALFLAALLAYLQGTPIVQMPALHTKDLASKVSWVRKPTAVAA